MHPSIRMAAAFAVVALACAAGPARSARADRVEIHDDADSRTAYVYVRNDGKDENTSGSGEASDFDDARTLRSRMHGDYLWFRIGDQRYVTQDREALRQLREALGPVEELGRRQGELGRKQGEIGRLQGEVGRLQGRIGAEQARISVREAMSGDDRNQESRDQRKDDLEREMHELGAQMDRLSRRMEPLASQQAELGRQQGKASAHLQEVADRVLHDLRNSDRAEHLHD